ncbi:hypothetical protein V8E54_009700 [Elaphomyces granulatus]
MLNDSLKCNQDKFTPHRYRWFCNQLFLQIAAPLTDGIFLYSAKENKSEQAMRFSILEHCQWSLSTTPRDPEFGDQIHQLRDGRCVVSGLVNREMDAADGY